MGSPEPVAGERANEGGAELREFKVFAQNTGICVEEPLREDELALHLGSGKVYWPGWKNVDLYSERADVKCDLRALHFTGGSVDRACAVHVLEHFYQWEVAAVLLEWKRVLKPGGQIILELPCMDSVFGHIAARLRKGQSPAPFMSWLPLWGDPSYKRPEMCHKWGYFKHDMNLILAAAGFTDIQHHEARYHFKIRDMRVTARKPQETA